MNHPLMLTFQHQSARQLEAKAVEKKQINKPVASSEAIKFLHITVNL